MFEMIMLMNLLKQKENVLVTKKLHGLMLVQANGFIWKKFCVSST